MDGISIYGYVAGIDPITQAGSSHSAHLTVDSHGKGFFVYDKELERRKNMFIGLDLAEARRDKRAFKNKQRISNKQS